jgi:hypothetical protein
MGVIAKCDKGRENDEESRPAVIEREWKMNEQLIRKRLRRVVLLHDVINVCDSGGHEQREDESDDVMVADEQVNVDGVEHTKQRKTPGNAVDDDAFTSIEELIDDGTEEKKVNEGPDPK